MFAERNGDIGLKNLEAVIFLLCIGACAKNSILNPGSSYPSCILKYI